MPSSASVQDPSAAIPSAASLSQSKPSTRLVWLDVIKGAAMVLIVYGHVVQGLAHSGRLGEFYSLYTLSNPFIYSLHLPALFFASGVTAERSLRKGKTTFLGDKVRTLLWPYWVWTTISLLVGRFFGSFSNNPLRLTGWEIPARYLYNPGGSWFFFALIVVHLAFMVLQPWTTPLSVVGLSVLCGFAPHIGVHWIDSAIVLAPFYFLGVLVGRRLDLFERLRVGPCLAYLVVGVALQCLALQFGLNKMQFPYLLIRINGAALMVAAAWLLQRTPTARSFAALGAASIALFVAHPFFQGASRVVMMKLLHIDHPLLLVFGQTLCAVVGPYLLWLAAQRLKLDILFAFPRRKTPKADTPPASADAPPSLGWSNGNSSRSEN